MDQGLPSGTMPRFTKGKVSLAPAQAKRRSKGSWRPVKPTPAWGENSKRAHRRA